MWIFNVVQINTKINDLKDNELNLQQLCMRVEKKHIQKCTSIQRIYTVVDKKKINKLGELAAETRGLN